MTTGPLSEQRYALLRLDGLTLAVEQQAIKALEGSADIIVRQHAENPSYILPTAWGDYPVYSLDKDLAVLLPIPKQRRIGVLLEAGATPYALVCDTVELLEQAPDYKAPLPRAMQPETTPIAAILVSRGILLPVLEPARLAALLNVPGYPEAQKRYG